MENFVDAYGVEIEVHSWPVRRPHGVVQISHGIAEHGGRYAMLAADLNRAGWSVVADDHRGHGRTGVRQWSGDASKLGRAGPGGLRATIAAVETLSERIREAHPDLPIVMLGHSWGSLMAQITVDSSRVRFDGLVLSGTAYRWPGWMDGGDLNRRHAVAGGLGTEWLSRDPAVQRAFLEDPLTTARPLIRLLGVRDSLRLFGRPARGLPADLPVLIQVGSDDTLGAERSAQRLARAYRERSGITDVDVRVYEGARHEVYNETNRVSIIAELVGWLDDHVRRHGAGGIRAR